MIGLVPKSTFLTWMRNKHAKKGALSSEAMKAEVRDQCLATLYHFSKTGKICTKNSVSPLDARTSLPFTRSSVDDNEDWVQDTEAANCQVTDTQRLSSYSLEYLMTLPTRTRLLLLVCIDDDDKLFALKGER